MRYRMKAAWAALCGRPVVAHCHLAGTLTLGRGTRGAVIVNNRVVTATSTGDSRTRLS